jgi:hypothetical protein
LDFKQRIIINGKRKENMDNDGWMANETAFSSIKRMFVGEYTLAIRFQNGKRDNNEDIVIQPV